MTNISLKTLKNNINIYYNFSKNAQSMFEQINKLLQYISENPDLLKRNDVKNIVMQLAANRNMRAIELLDPYDRDMLNLLSNLQEDQDQRVVELANKIIEDYRRDIMIDEEKYFGYYDTPDEDIEE